MVHSGIHSKDGVEQNYLDQKILLYLSLNEAQEIELTKLIGKQLSITYHLMLIDESCQQDK